jgi:hypothetical protein
MTAIERVGGCLLVGCLLALAVVGCGTSPRAAISPSVGASPTASATATLGSWSYGAFGDSPTFGSGDVGGASFVGILGHLIERHRPVSVAIHNLAFDGGTSATLLDALQHDPAFQRALRKLTWSRSRSA